MGHYKSESEIEAVVRGFESCSTRKEDFSHPSHLTVAIWYLRDSTLEHATEKMRAGLLRFVDHHGINRQKYNQTLTTFWMKVISESLEGMNADLCLLEVTNSLIETLSVSSLAFEYYSPELLGSDEARNGWVEPDLKPLRFDSQDAKQPEELSK